jgi:hypothetical protein
VRRPRRPGGLAVAARGAGLVDGRPHADGRRAGRPARDKWLRRQAATEQWAGAGIPLNAVAPGVIATPMTADLIGTPEARHALLGLVPMPLNGIAEPIVVARLLAWLTSEENTHLCGQIVYIDGGSDVVLRGDSVW